MSTTNGETTYYVYGLGYITIRKHIFGEYIGTRRVTYGQYDDELMVVGLFSSSYGITENEIRNEHNRPRRTAYQISGF